jgi:hypothetical protein
MVLSSFSLHRHAFYCRRQHIYVLARTRYCHPVWKKEDCRPLLKLKNRPVNEFRSVVLLVVYLGISTRRPSLAFIEAVFSPVPMLGKFETQHMKIKVSVLKYGKKLFEFGLYPNFILMTSQPSFNELVSRPSLQK